MLVQLFLSTVLGQETSPAPVAQPEKVMSEFRAMETSGGRLTKSGWEAGNRFFVHCNPFPKRLAVMVVEGREIVYRDDIYFKAESKSAIHVKYGTLGQIDWYGRFVTVAWPTFVDEYGKIRDRLTAPYIPGGTRADQEFVFEWTDTHWNCEFVNGSLVFQQIKGQWEWRMAKFLHQPQVNVDTAIRYLAELRDHSKEARIRSNATKSIKQLKQIQESRKGLPHH